MILHLTSESIVVRANQRPCYILKSDVFKNSRSCLTLTLMLTTNDCKSLTIDCKEMFKNPAHGFINNSLGLEQERGREGGKLTKFFLESR